MNNYDLIGAIRTAATANGYAFLSGDDFIKNYEASKETYSTDQLILAVDPPVARPTMKNSVVISIRYSGIIMLGQKKETTTQSNLDETFIQKYDRRLKDLSSSLSDFIGSFACTHELDIDSIDISMRLNTYDENIDFVVANVVLIQG